MKLTVIIRDPGPVVFLNEPVSHRRVTFELTPEQKQMLKLRCTGTSGTTPIHEDISVCFLEDLEYDEWDGDDE